MKLLKLATLICALCFMTTGCDTSSDSPENLLDDKIIYNKEYNELYTFVNKSLDSTTLLLPKNSSEVGEINKLGENIIAFQEQQDVNTNINQVGFVLLSKDSKEYKLEDNILVRGESIEYANFYDINNDKKDEVILLIRNNGNTILNVYSINNNKIEPIKSMCNLLPTWLENYYKYNNTKIQIGFINNDSILDILMLNCDYSSGDMYATILNCSKDNKLKVSNSVKIPNVKSLNDLYSAVGKVYNDKNGVILSMPTLKESAYATQILYMSGNTLNKAFKDDKTIYNSYYVPVKDANNDGIMDIPVLNNSMIENYSSSTKASSLISWRTWNNKKGKDGDTIFISQVYYNYKNNFKFLVPDNLANKLYIQKNIVNNSTYYGFYYYEKYDKEPVEIFQICIYPKNIVEDTKTGPKMETVLTETDNNYYQLIVKNKDAFKKYDLTLENMKEYFSIIYK